RAVSNLRGAVSKSVAGPPGRRADRSRRVASAPIRFEDMPRSRYTPFSEELERLRHDLLVRQRAGALAGSRERFGVDHAAGVSDDQVLARLRREAGFRADGPAEAGRRRGSLEVPPKRGNRRDALQVPDQRFTFVPLD